MRRLLLVLAIAALPALLAAQAVQNFIAPTPPPGTSNDQIATTAFVQNAIGTGVGNGVLFATNFAGATNGAKIAACVAAIPTSGGVCDARGLPTGGTIPAMQLTKGGVTILGPCGSHTVTGTILISNSPALQMSGFRWQGCNGDFNHTGTEFVWGGNQTDCAIVLAGVRDSDLSNFSIVASSPALFCGIGQNALAGGPLNNNNGFREIAIEGTAGAGASLTVGMRWYGPAGNNDFSKIERVNVSGYNTAAFSIENAQSKAHQFVNSLCIGASVVNSYCVTNAFANATTATVGAGGTGYTTGPITLTVVGGTGPSGGACPQQPVYTATGAGGAITAPVLSIPGMCTTMPSNPVATTGGGGTGGTLNIASVTGGDFNALNMGIAHNGGCDFFLGSPNDTINIIGGNSESSARLLCTLTATSAGWPVIISGIRWSPDQINPDQKAILWQMKGGLTLMNNLIGTANVGSYPFASLEASSFGTQAVAIGNVWSWDTAVAGSNPFVATAGSGGRTQWRLIGNTINGHSSGGSLPVADSIAGPQLFYKTTNGAFFATIAAAGSGCTNGAQVLTATTGTGTQASFNVTVAGNVVTSINTLAGAGAYTVDPTDPAPMTGASCTGVTFHLLHDVPLVPACDANHDGFEIWANDATSPTYRGAYSGGGAVKSRMICVNGTGWLTN